MRRALAQLFSSSGWLKLAQIATGLTAVAALYFSAQSLRSTQNQYALSAQGQLSDRFNRSIEQLGSDKSDVRLGGIYSLEQLAQDSPAHGSIVVEVLGAYVRTHAGPNTNGCAHSLPPEDVEAVLKVIQRHVDPLAEAFRRAEQTGGTAIVDSQAGDQTIDLSGACLYGAGLATSDLPFADLRGTTLVWANLNFANLSNAYLNNADLSYAELKSARLSWSDQTGADLTGADLTGADLSHAILANADLSNADLTGADLTGAGLTNIYYNKTTRWPGDFNPPPSRSVK
jgi:hypothetical protein